jgi:hypothetical protein
MAITQHRQGQGGHSHLRRLALEQKNELALDIGRDCRVFNGMIMLTG